jgi:hypothetical protein
MSEFEINLSLCDISSCVSISTNDVWIFQKIFFFRDDPSAILDVIETATLLN